jgi:hypothetical protein
VLQSYNCRQQKPGRKEPINMPDGNEDDFQGADKRHEMETEGLKHMNWKAATRITAAMRSKHISTRHKCAHYIMVNEILWCLADFEILKNGVFWDVMPCGSCKVLTRATWCNIPEDAILHSHHCENLKSYILNSD